MSLAVVLGPAFADLAGSGLSLSEEAAGGAVTVRVRNRSESAADRCKALRGLLAEGVDTVLVVDSAAPARPDWTRGGPDMALVAEHLRLTGDNPLVGANDDAWGPRFPDLTDAGDPERRRAHRPAAAAARVELREGVVAVVASDRLTAAELAMLRTLGADMVATGFADEAIVARHAGRRVAGLAVFSDDAGGRDAAKLEVFLRAALPVLTSGGAAA
jgi:purine-nucleoside phosphorylase